MEYCTYLNFADNGAEIVQLLDYKMAVEKWAVENYGGDEDGDFRMEFIGFLLKYKIYVFTSENDTMFGVVCQF